MKSCELKRVLITGGGGGIGGALALRFARDGCSIGVCGRDSVKLDAICQRGAGAIVSQVCDVTDAEATRRWLLASDDGAPVDCVIACAGFGGAQTLETPGGDAWNTARKTIDVNVQGVVNTVTPLLPRMLARRAGRIVIIASLAGLIALPDSPAYSASKAAVIAYGESLRRLLRSYGIAVTVVCPGFVETDMTRSLPMRLPFLWSAERAADVIVRGVYAKRPMVAFPWQLRGAIGLSHVLPRFIVDFILGRLRARNFGS